MNDTDLDLLVSKMINEHFSGSEWLDAISNFENDLRDYQKRLFWRVMRLTSGDEQLSLDMVQNAFESAIRNEVLGQDYDLRWLYKAVKNCLNYYYRDHAKAIHIEGLELAETEMMKPFQIDFKAGEISDPFYFALMDLPLDERTVLYCSYYLGYDLFSISQLMGTSFDVVKKLSAKGIKHLKDSEHLKSYNRVGVGA